MAAARGDPALELQIVPVSIFWGRAPQKQESILRALFADTWVVPGTFKQLVRVALHGRDTLLKFGAPISLRTVMAEAAAEGLDERTSLRRVARLLRAEFRRERELAVGPNLSHRQTLLNEVIGSARGAARDRAGKRSARRIRLDQAELAARRIAYGIASDYSYPFIRALDIALTRLWNRIYDGVERAPLRGRDRRRQRRRTDLRALPPQPHRLSAAVLRDLPPRAAAAAHRRRRQPQPAADRTDPAPRRRLLPAPQLQGRSAVRRGVRPVPSCHRLARLSDRVLRRGRTQPHRAHAARPRPACWRCRSTAILRGIKRPLVFVPVYVGYEQPLEGESYAAELAGKPKEKESVAAMFGTLKKLRRRFGKVHVNVGEPIHLERFLDRAVARVAGAGASADDGCERTPRGTRR
ncbi:MAG: hypothetical protein MZW92_38285 [Comamonadaceae bacterium]|nr:hypothetical protein [Comamonadaceae bacterium]